MLNFQTASINLTKGLETKDDELLADGNDVMQNVDMSKAGTPRKRHGLKKYSANRYLVNENGKTLQEVISQANEAIPFQNRKLISDGFFSYVFSEIVDGYISNTIPFGSGKDADLSLPLLEAKGLGVERLDGNLSSSSGVFFAENSKYYAYGIGDKLFTKSKGGSQVIGQKSDSTVNAPRLVELNDTIYVFYISDFSDGDIYKFAKINDDGFLEDISNIINPLDISFGRNLTYSDAVHDGASLYCVTWGASGGSPVLVINKLNEAGTILAIYNYAGDGSGVYQNAPIQIAVGNGHVCVSYPLESSASSGVFYTQNLQLDTDLNFVRVFNSSSSSHNTNNYEVFTGISGDTLFLATTLKNGVVETETSPDTFSDNYNEKSKILAHDLTDGSQITPGVSSVIDLNGARVLSKPIVSENAALFLTGFRLDEESDNFLFDYGLIKFTPRSGSALCGLFTKGETVPTGSSFFMPSNIGFSKSFIVRANGPARAKRFLLNLTRENTGAFSEVFGQTVIPGAMPASFDGFQLRPLGLYTRPKLVSAATSAGNVPAGTYDYKAIFVQTDAQGNIARSRESNDFQVTLGSPQRVELDFGTYGILDQYLNDLEVQLYRKESTETVYRLTTSAIAVSNGSIVDNTADISEQPTLYTTGDILESEQPPALKDIASHSNRLFGVSLDGKVYFSKTGVRGESFEFNEFFTINVDENQGRRSQSLQAIAGLDNKLIVFKENSIFAIFGNGPDSTGANNDFTLPELITTDVGCDSPRSIVLNSGGVYFKGEKGIYQLTRGTQLSFAGADVDRFRSEVITSAVLLEESNRVVFTTKSGVGLVHNYNRETWTTYTNFDAVSAFMSNDKFLMFKSDATAWEEKDDFDDDGAFIEQKMTTNWLNIAGIQGFQRIQRLFLVGRYKGDHTMKVRVYYDYEDYFWDEYTLTPTDADYNESVKPSLSDYHNEVNNGVFQWNIHLKKQKCQAIKIEIFDEQRGATPTEAFFLSNITAKIGVKKGLFKGTSTKAV